jgi:predicted ArsR family transcriptional regulator
VILSDLKRYLSEREQASLADLALHFGVEPDAVRTMLEVWMRKGQVERSSVSPNCGGNCNRCAPETTEIYRWRKPTTE